MDRAAADDWIRAHVEPVTAIEMAHERPWATVLRVPLAESVAWFKACSLVQAFEPRLTAGLVARWPDRVAEVLGHDEERAWLLLADAGTPIGVFGNPPEAWLVALPLYAELQRGEAAHTQRFAELCGELAAHDVPETVQHDDLHMANVYAQGSGCACSTGTMGGVEVGGHDHRQRSLS